jgi:hypothetical protein
LSGSNPSSRRAASRALMVCLSHPMVRGGSTGLGGGHGAEDGNA